MKIFSKIYMGLIFLFLYAPIVVMIAFSFNNSKSRSVWNGFTFDWYTKLFHDESIIDALKTTLLVAIVASIFATIIGTLGAIGISAMKNKLKSAVMLATNIPMVNPEIVTGVSLMLLFVSVFGVLSKVGIELEFGLLTLILSHISFNIPYVILSVLPKLRQMNKHSYEAALDLGCNPFKAFFKVVIPEIMPGIMTGMLMAFTLSLDDFVISYCTSGTSAQTLSVLIYSMTRKNVSPKINALSALMFVTVFILMLIVNIRQMKDENKAGAKK
ncbi:MAG: ABC transporter permease [Acutalibacteraceae bacterium]|nr:ABC transporter permease [Acutalibacteraceae bacterium]